jgi:putative hydrolase of the HAD superfamily
MAIDRTGHGKESSVFPVVDLEGVRGVLIDIDNTLYAYQPAHEAGLRETFACWREHVDPLTDFEIYRRDYRAQRDRVTAALSPHGSCRSRLLAFQAMLEAAGHRPAYSLAAELEQRYWSALIDSAQVNADAVAFLGRCRERSIPVCAVTDMQALFQVRKLEAFGVAALVDYMVTSEEVGEEKPSASMFEAALHKLGLRTHDVVMIGDDENKDMEGARCLNIRTYKVCWPGQ